MFNFFLGILAGYIILSFLHEKWWGQKWMNFIQLPYLLIYAILEIILEIILFPFIFLWKLFRNVIKPVKSEAVQNLNLWKRAKHVVGPIYFIYDNKAKRIVNKCFFFRTIDGGPVKIIEEKTEEPLDKIPESWYNTDINQERN